MALRTFLLGLASLVALAGCRSIPPGYMEVKAAVKPRDRAIAVLPFRHAVGEAYTSVDGIRLAERTVADLKRAVPDVRVVGPNQMDAIFTENLNEGRWAEVARKLSVQLLVVGEITFLEAHYDKELASRQGAIGLQFRVLELKTGSEVPAALARVNWRLAFPPGPTDKFDPRYTSMEPRTFRDTMLAFAASKVAGTFYDHLEKAVPTSQLDVEMGVK